MTPSDRNESEKQGKSSISTFLNTAAIIVALIGLALLILNIYIYITTVSQYTAQGYPAGEVRKSLIPGQLLPGIFEPVAVYWGIACILTGLGAQYKRKKNRSAIPEENAILTDVEKTEPNEESTTDPEPDQNQE